MATNLNRNATQTAAPVLALIGLGLGVCLIAVRHFSDSADTSSITASQPALLDPNTARWWELSALPRLGASLARRIVEFRETERTKTGRPDLRVFQRLDDLRRVRGVGPATLELLRPYLLFSD